MKKLFCLLLTVLCFSISNISLAVYVKTVALSSVNSLPKTGQTTSYTTRDDGALQKGATWPNPRFTVGINIEADCVTDNLTGLMWVKSPDSAARIWQQALDYANNLTLCGFSDWRLPNRKELRSLVNYGKSNTAVWLNTQGFGNVQPNYYWSSTTRSARKGYVFIVHMVYGYVFFDIRDFPNYTWPVRSGVKDAAYAAAIDLPDTGQTNCYDAVGETIACANTGQDGELQKGITWPNPRFMANTATVTDNLTGLVWAMDGGTPTIGSCIGGSMT